jgi:glutamyl-tRNA synthetase
MTPEQVLEQLQTWKLNDATWLKIIPLAQKRLEALSDLMPLAGFLFADRLEYSPLDLVPKKLEAEQVVPLLRKALWGLNDLRQWDAQSLQDIFERMSEQEELKLKQLLPIFFVAVCGKPVSLPLFDSMELLGKDMVQRRLQYALEALATEGFELKGKKLKALEKEFRQQQSSRR